MAENNIPDLNLLENGLDFILKGIDELYELDDNEYEQYPSPIFQPQKNWKYGVINLFAGFLLLLKERLSRHWSLLIYAGRMEDVKNKLKSKEKKLPNTVTLDEALERLEMGPRVTFSDSDTQVIRKFQKYRNSFEHYEISNISESEIKKVINDFIDLIYRFLLEHLEIDLVSTHYNTNLTIARKIRLINSIYTRLENKREREVIALGKEKVKRFKWVRRSVLRKLNEENEIYFNDPDADGDSFGVCPKCEENTLITDGEFAGVCFNKECYSYTPLKRCDKCGAITEGYEWVETWCNNCDEELQRMIERDD
jgi:hypothetical protein